MRSFYFIFLFFLPLFGFSQISKVSINDGWSFSSEDEASFSSTDFNHSSWQKINIPHTWNAKDAIDETRGYRRGASWYRKEMVLANADYSGKKIVLRFNAIANKAEIYFNGELLKTHLGGYTAFTVDVTDKIDLNKKNIIAIKADNSASLGEILPPVSGDFTMWGGIYRDVWVEIYDKVFFDFEPYASSGILLRTPSVSSESASVEIIANIKNESDRNRKLTVSHVILDKERTILTQTNKKYSLKKGQNQTFTTLFKDLKNPKLWSPQSPYLYTVKSQIKDDATGEILQTVESPLGFRWFSVDASGFYLNGQKIKLRGAARHQDYEGIGIAIPLEINRNDMKQLKEMGANFVRISHYPQDPEIYRACDELGLIAWSEIAIVNEVKRNRDFATNSKEMMKEMMYQNYNHPSIVMWGAMNELWDYHPEAMELAHELEAMKKTIDPYRLSCVAFHAFTWEKPYKQDTKEMFNISDINGVNVYEAWYQGDSTTIAPMFDKLRTFSDKKPMFLSEFGAGSDQRIHSYTPQCFDFSMEYQIDFNRWYINEIEARDYFVGYSIWNFIDFQVDGRVDTQPNINNKGMVTPDRKEKEIFYYFQARWSDKPILYISGKDWTQRIEMCDTRENLRRVAVFSNQNSVELRLNGKSLGIKNIIEGEAIFSVPFVDGKNNLEAFSGNLKDNLTIDMTLLSSDLSKNKSLSDGLYVNVGQDHCYFFEPLTQRMWIPDGEYKAGSWGYVGGEVFDSWPNMKGHDGVRKGIAGNIKNSNLEPIYQTFMLGLKSYKFDVPAGVYEVSLHFAEPFNANERKNATRSGVSEDGERVFDVSINNQLFLSQLNLSKDYGDQMAVVKTSIVNTDGGLTVDFNEIKGRSILNGIKILKIK